MIRRRTLLLGAVALLAGCGGGKERDGPPSISYGKVACARCGMIISEERHAAGLTGDDPLIFDDTGEMIATVQERGLGDRKVWVHDYDSKEWIDGTAASYVVLAERRTPMGTGVIAFRDRPAADAFAAQNPGSVMTWVEIQANWTIR